MLDIGRHLVPIRGFIGGNQSLEPCRQDVLERAKVSPLPLKSLFFCCRITSMILKRIPRSLEGNHNGASR